MKQRNLVAKRRRGGARPAAHGRFLVVEGVFGLVLRQLHESERAALTQPGGVAQGDAGLFQRCRQELAEEIVGEAAHEADGRAEPAEAQRDIAAGPARDRKIGRQGRCAGRGCVRPGGDEVDEGVAADEKHGRFVAWSLADRRPARLVENVPSGNSTGPPPPSA